MSTSAPDGRSLAELGPLLHVDGPRLVMVTTSSPDTGEADLAEMQAIVDSIQIEG